MTLLIISIPFFSSLSVLLFGRYLGQKGVVLISKNSMIITILISINLLYNNIKYNEILKINIYEWINTGVLKIPFNLILDKKGVWMIFLISSVAGVVIWYSTWYMYKDPHKNRFLGYLLMFAVTMLILVTSNNLFIMFVGWEGVGIMSYLLINFWYTSINSNKSALKAILYNKIGDIGFIIGISMLLYNISSTNIWVLYNMDKINEINIILIFFVIAAIAKSAQIFLHCWLGDAMAGPTPVSALLHAATMVTAGVFLLFRLESILFLSPQVRNIIIIIGVVTILFGGISSINQNDIKKIIAFSTCSQLGYMFLTNGLLLPSAELGFFHLLTHGFFKALLFLTAGIIIHNRNNIQDIRKYGSVSTPYSYLFILIGSLSIISFPFLSGFYSKESIIESSLSNNYPIYIYILMVLGAFFTCIYSFKLIYFTFFIHPLGKSQLYPFQLEIPKSYTPLLILLSLGSIFFGYYFKELFIITPATLNEFIPYQIKLIPLIVSCFATISIFINITPFYYNMNLFLSPLNKRFFFDSIINYFIGLKILKWGYLYTLKFLDRGVFEFFGPLGFFRSFYSLPLSFKIKMDPFSKDIGLKSNSQREWESNLLIYLLYTYAFFFFFLFI